MKTPSILTLCLSFLTAPNLWAAINHGPLDRAQGGPRSGLDSVLRWNGITLAASALDHTPPAAGETRAFGQQAGPCRSSRALAIVHVAMFDALNAVSPEYHSYADMQAPRGAVSVDAAVSQAAHDTLSALFPAQAAIFDARLAEDLGAISSKNTRANGIELGQRTAAAILALRLHDGAEVPESFIGVDYATSNLPGHWRMDPISQLPVALGSHWGACVPFVVESGSQFRVPPPPALNSPEYTAAYEEVKRVGGDGVVTPTERTLEQTIIGIFWGYDGTPFLGTPPNLFNQITVHIARQQGSSALETARLLALVNLAMADAVLNVWESKYLYDFWRPITGLRESDPGTGPTGQGDGNSATVGDPSFTPLGAPASNLNAPNFTPPFPAYPSGHAGLGGATFQTLRRFYGTDNIAFTFVSDELNGVTRDNHGNVRPLILRSFSTLSQAEEENGQSRIYLGIHWQFDKRSVVLGRNVADYVFDHALVPAPPRDR